MKKIILFIALLMSVASGFSQQRSHAFTYNYVYDAYRTPTFPAVGDIVTLYNFDIPLIGYNRRGTVKDIHANWELFSLGKYSPSHKYPGPGYPLSSLVGNMAKEYKCRMSDIEVYELTCEGRTVCYGIICFRDSRGLFFIGNSWTYGAGYFLSVNKCHDKMSFRIVNGMRRVQNSAPPRDERHESTRRTYEDREQRTSTSVRKMR